MLTNPYTFPKKYDKASIQNVYLEQDKQEIDKIKNWIFSTQTNKGPLFFFGAAGRGKTYTAIACLYFLNKFGKIPWNEIKFVNSSELNQEWLYWDALNRYENLKKLQEATVLVLDDLGVKQPSEAFMDYLYAIINNRDGNMKPSFYITNLSSIELNNCFGPRFVSRLMSGEVIYFKKDDLRKKYG